MGEREQLREALASRLSMRSDVDAVLAVLDQQGWPDEVTQGDCAEGEDDSRTGMIARLRTAEAERDAALRALAEADNHHNAGACPYCTHNGEFVLCQASELAALREAARYEPSGWVLPPDGRGQPRWGDNHFDNGVPLYRRVTEGEEG